MNAKPEIAIIGAGLMGHGIAQVFAVGGCRVRVFDVSAESLATLRDRIRKNLRDLGQDESAVELVTSCSELADTVHAAQFVFEAGPENLEFKQKVFAEIEAAAPEDTVLASNTSVIPITRIMAGLRCGGRALGTHWWNPPYLVPLVEVIQTPDTTSEAVDAISALLRAVGKTPVTVKRDVPGFVGNRLQHALWREAIALVQSGVCDAETVDTVVKSSFGRRLAVLGPLENADLVGTDLTLAIHENVLFDLDRTAGPLPYLQQLVDSGKLGMKCGQGFRSWTPEQQAELRHKVLEHLKKLNEQGI